MTKISLRMDAPGDEPALRSLFVLWELESKEETREQHVDQQGKVKSSRRRTGVPQE
jgi:hypothetical protein